MFKYLWKKLKAAVMDEEEGKILVGVISRSVMMWAGTLSGIIIASTTTAEDGFDLSIVMTWGWKDWLARLGAAALVSFAVLIRAGNQNKTPEQLVEQLRVAGYRIERATPVPQPPAA